MSLGYSCQGFKGIRTYVLYTLHSWRRDERRARGSAIRRGSAVVYTLTLNVLSSDPAETIQALHLYGVIELFEKHDTVTCSPTGHCQ